jgi:hypothetical protein
MLEKYKMKSSCFVCPIHEPKFHEGLNLLKSYHKYYDDDNSLFFIFSSLEDFKKFKLMSNNLSFKSIIFLNYSKKGIQTKKKFIGVQYVFDNTNFEYVATIDADTEFFKTVDYDQLFKNYYKKSRIFGNYFDRYVKKNKHLINITTAPLDFFTEDDKKIIKNKTNNFQFYFWYNDIPIYKKSIFLDFMQYIDYKNRIKDIDWKHFDFFLYAYYLIKENIFKPTLLLDAEVGTMVEDQYEMNEEVFKLMFKKSKPMWIKKDIDKKLMNNTFMHVHLDRQLGKEHVTSTF